MSSAASQHEIDDQSHHWHEDSQHTSAHGGQRSSHWSPLIVEIFLQLVEKHLPQLNDKQSRNSQVWNTIARELKEKVSHFFMLYSSFSYLIC